MCVCVSAPPPDMRMTGQIGVWLVGEFPKHPPATRNVAQMHMRCLSITMVTVCIQAPTGLHVSLSRLKIISVSVKDRFSERSPLSQWRIVSVKDRRCLGERYSVSQWKIVSVKDRLATLSCVVQGEALFRGVRGGRSLRPLLEMHLRHIRTRIDGFVFSPSPANMLCCYFTVCVCSTARVYVCIQSVVCVRSTACVCVQLLVCVCVQRLVCVCVCSTARVCVCVWFTEQNPGTFEYFLAS